MNFESRDFDPQLLSSFFLGRGDQSKQNSNNIIQQTCKKCGQNKENNSQRRCKRYHSI